MDITVSGNVGGRDVSERSVVVYQRRGDFMSGIYVYGGTPKTRRALAMRASAASARNLARA